MSLMAESEATMRHPILFALLLILLSGFALPAFAHQHDPPRIWPAEVMQRLKAGEQISFLDSRTEAAHMADNATIPQAIRIENNEVLRRFVSEAPKDRLIVTFCT